MTYKWDENSRKRVLSHIMQYLHHKDISSTNNFPQVLVEKINVYIENFGMPPDSALLLKLINNSKSRLFQNNHSLNKQEMIDVIIESIKSNDIKSINDKPALTPNDEPKAIRLYLDDIDSFKQVQSIKPSSITNKFPLCIPEVKIKEYLAEILGESFVPKDWGGETADLFSTYVIYHNRRIATGFLLKGPGIKKDILKMNKLGKNGDQIIRLTKENIDLYVIQFVGQIDQAVKDHLDDSVYRASKRAGRNLYYCIIDGIDTARLCYAYNKKL